MHKSRVELDAGLETIRNSPKDEGMLLCIVRRPQKYEREVLQEGRLTMEQGLVGDNWRNRRSSKMPEGTPYAETQITMMNSRAIETADQMLQHLTNSL